LLVPEIVELQRNRGLLLASPRDPPGSSSGLMPVTGSLSPWVAACELGVESFTAFWTLGALLAPVTCY
jgi:hypothetical protein